MWGLGWITSVWPSKAEKQAPPGSRRDRLAVLLALVTIACLGSAFFFSRGTQFLMPGPLTSAHGGIENCSACHTHSGSGKLSWLHGLFPGDPLADSKACLACHKMPDTAFNAHGATLEVLKQSTDRLTKIAASTPAPRSAQAQNAAFPTHDMAARGLSCATCHQEHQGANFNLNKISNEQCRSCHVVKFDSFDGHHPQFEAYPFRRRTRIIYDHAGHFGKHYPDIAKKDPAKRIPDTCSTCHNSREDKRVMAVAPFEQTCAGCHLDQITGKERVSGPKGVAFLSLPGLDLATLKKKNASIGEWPEMSDAALTPFMKLMISRNERGRAVIKTVDGLNLQDLTTASDDQIKAVTNLVWEIKGLFHGLIKGKASDVLSDLNITAGQKLSAPLVADLTASIPRDVVTGAHREWLPNLATEMANRPAASDQEQSDWSTEIKESELNGSASPAEPSDFSARQVVPKPNPQAAGSGAAKANTTKARADGSKKTRSANDLPPPMRAGVMDARKADEPAGAARKTRTANADADDGTASGTVKRWQLPSGTPRSIEAAKAAQRERATGKSDTANTDADARKETPSPDEHPRAIEPGAKDAETAGEPQGASGPADTSKAKTDGGKETRSTNEPPPGNATDQTDDLLFLTEEELRATNAGSSEKVAEPKVATGKAATANAKPDGVVSGDAAITTDTGALAVAPADSGTAAVEPQSTPALAPSIESDVDPESWAEHGGWYRQDYAIFYRPAGHKDKFIYSWLVLTGPHAPKGDTSPAAAVFDDLTSKDAQGSCTKCHSVDEIQGKGRVVNFSPPSIESKTGRFTNFIHEPHFGVVDNRDGLQEKRGCLTCHELEKGRPYLKSYEQDDPQNFSSNFGDVKKDLCQTCHTRSMARQDCLLCHAYHVNDVVTPIMSTKLPSE